MGFDSKKLRLQLKTAEGELQYYHYQSNNRKMNLYKQLETIDKNNRLLFKENLEALIKEENLAGLYEAALTYIGMIMYNVYLFENRHPDQQCQQFIATIYFLAPRLKSKTLKLAEQLVTKQFKILPPQLVEQDLILLGNSQVDPLYLQKRINELLGEQPIESPANDEVDKMKSILANL